MSTDSSVFSDAIIASAGPLRLIAVSFLSVAPPGVPQFSGTVPSGCTFWNLALAGDGFYTVPGDHLNCPIGSYTHAIDLPAARAPELEQTLSLMASIGYLRLEDVPSIPRLSRPPAFIYYAPLGSAKVPPDVVIAAGQPGRLMRLQEAAVRAGAASMLPLLARPTCMALPAAMAHGSVMSTGCIGNRVYTGLGDDELYLMIPGPRLAEVVRELAVIASANDTLLQYHQQRRAALTS
jgi:uncharacterized protein (DUF169 family)